MVSSSQWRIRKKGDAAIDVKVLHHFYLIIGITALVCGTHYLCRSYHNAGYLTAVNRATALRMKAIEAEWRKHDFTNAEPSIIADQVLSRFKWSELAFTGSQEADLRIRIKETFSYFTDPSYEGYLRLRTEGSGSESELKTNLNVYFRETNPTKDFASQDTLKCLWDGVHRKNGIFLAPKITAISLSSIKSCQTRSSSSTELLTGEVKQGFTVATEALNPFANRPSYQANAQENLYFSLSFLAKINHWHPIAA